jgi:hypothetical protein
LIETGEPLENIDLWYGRGQTYSELHHRYRHTVVKAMLATNEISLLAALTEMRKQIQSDEKRADGLSLPGGLFVLHNFGAAIAGKKSDKVDNFLVELAP